MSRARLQQHYGPNGDKIKSNRANFGGLVLGCINADRCVQILIVSGFSRSPLYNIIKVYFILLPFFNAFAPSFSRFSPPAQVPLFLAPTCAGALGGPFWPLLAVSGAGVRETLSAPLGKRRIGHDTSLFSKIVLGYIETKFCKQIV